jgi:hypothetical protein
MANSYIYGANCNGVELTGQAVEFDSSTEVTATDHFKYVSYLSKSLKSIQSSQAVVDCFPILLPTAAHTLSQHPKWHRQPPSNFSVVWPNSSTAFDAEAPNNLAVYFGQTIATGQTTVLEVCSHSAVNIIILGFIVDLFGPGGFPALNFGAACFAQSAQQVGTNLLSCPELATHITRCQGLGKKVLLSLGSAIGTPRIVDTEQGVRGSWPPLKPGQTS